MNGINWNDSSRQRMPIDANDFPSLFASSYFLFSFLAAQLTRLLSIKARKEARLLGFGSIVSRVFKAVNVTRAIRKTLCKGGILFWFICLLPRRHNRTTGGRKNNFRIKFPFICLLRQDLNLNFWWALAWAWETRDGLLTTSVQGYFLLCASQIRQ